MATCSSISPVVDCGPYGTCVNGLCVCQAGYSGRNDILTSLNGLQCTTSDVVVTLLWSLTLGLSVLTLLSNLKYMLRIAYKVLKATDDGRNVGLSTATSKTGDETTEADDTNRDFSRTAAASYNVQQHGAPTTITSDGPISSRRPTFTTPVRRMTYDAQAQPTAQPRSDDKGDTLQVDPTSSPSTPPPNQQQQVLSISASRNKVAVSPLSTLIPVDATAIDIISKIPSSLGLHKSPIGLSTRPSRQISTSAPATIPPLSERFAKLYKISLKPVYTSRLFAAMNNLLIILVCSIHLSSNGVDNTIGRSWPLTICYVVLSMTVSTSVAKLNLIFYNLTQQVLSKELRMQKQRIFGTPRQVMVTTTCLRYCSALGLLIPLIADNHTHDMETGVAIAYHGAGVVYGLTLIWMYGRELYLPSRTLIRQLEGQTLVNQKTSTLLEFAKRTKAVAKACTRGGIWLFVQELLICCVPIIRYSDIYTLPIKWAMVILASHQATKSLQMAKFASKVDKAAAAQKRTLSRRWTAAPNAIQTPGAPLSNTDDVLCVPSAASRRATLNMRRATFDGGRLAGDRLISINELAHVDAQHLIAPSPRSSYQTSTDAAVASRSQLQASSRRSTATLVHRYNSLQERNRAMTTPQPSFKQPPSSDTKQTHMVVEEPVTA